MQHAEQRDRLRGFAQAHLVGEHAAEAVAGEVVEPGDTEVLIRAERGGERGGQRSGLERGEIAQGGAVLAPGLGRLEIRGERLQFLLQLGGAVSGDALAGAGQQRGVEGAGEGLLHVVELFQRGGGYKENGSSVLDVAAALGELVLEQVGGRAADVERDGDIELAAGLGDLGGDGGDAELRGVAAEVVGELGAPALFEAFPMGGEKGEGAMAVAQPPLARGRFEGEAGGFQRFEDGGVGVAFARGEDECEVLLGAVDLETAGYRLGGARAHARRHRWDAEAALHTAGRERGARSAESGAAGGDGGDEVAALRRRGCAGCGFRVSSFGKGGRGLRGRYRSVGFD